MTEYHKCLNWVSQGIPAGDIFLVSQAFFY